MRIINLAENTEGAAGCGFEHGLCFYIETEHHKLLMDTGQSDLFIKNAEKLGIDLTQVDTVVISHGHYDHGGGILHFVKINPTAKIYIQAEAFGDYYSLNKQGEPRYIGLAKEIRDLPQVVIVDAIPLEEAEAGIDKPATSEAAEAPEEAKEAPTDAAEAPAEAIATAEERIVKFCEVEDSDTPADGAAAPRVFGEVEAEKEICRIDSELSLFTGIRNEYPVPSANQRLKMKTEEGLVQDDFKHEQCLVISEGTKKVLLSGCAHHGILNILDRYHELYGGQPDVVISGFHMMKKSGYSDEDITMIIDTALELRKMDTVFYTGHCTGVEPYNAMKKLMGDKLHYVHSGDEIRVRTTIDRIMWNVSEKAAKASGASKGSERSGAEMTKEEALKIAKKKRREYMKWHKFFAWGTVVCFVLTMVTGYQRK